MNPNDARPVEGDPCREPNSPWYSIPSHENLPATGEVGLMRRATAKLIDFVAVGFTVVGFSSFTHSYLTGLLVGYGWLAISDWGDASLGKRLTGINVYLHRTGAGCTLLASVIRNLPVVAVTLPHKLHQAWLGLDRRAYGEQHAGVVIAMAAVATIVLLFLAIGMANSPDQRHFGDRLAGTRVLRRRRPAL